MACKVDSVTFASGDSEVQRTMLELLNQLDGFEPKQNIKVRVDNVTQVLIVWPSGFSAYNLDV